MDIFLLIASIIVGVLLILVNIYLLAIYCHPDDSGFGASLFCKFLVVFGLTLSWAQILLMPLDISNSRGFGEGFNMELIWQIVYVLIVLMIVVLIPFGIFLYESDPDKSYCGRIIWAAVMTLGFIIFFGMAFFISSLFMSEAQIPFDQYQKDIYSFSLSNMPVKENEDLDPFQKKVITMNISFVIFSMALLSLIGWFLFVIFGGVGIVALPIDLIQEYISRPKQKDPRQLANTQLALRSKCQELVKLGKSIEISKENMKLESGWISKKLAESKLNKKMNLFKAQVFDLERENEILKLEKNLNESNPLVFFGKLLLGIFLGIIGLIWITHIIVYLVVRKGNVPFSLFLNNFFLGLEDRNLGFLATIVFTGFALYLIWSIQKGNIKFGLRILIIPIHPMRFIYTNEYVNIFRLNETWMNSFLVNVLLVLVSSISVTSFINEAFSQYTRHTSINTIFGTQIRYMKFFNFFFNNHIFVYALMIWSFLCLVYLLVRPKDHSNLIKEAEKKLDF